MKRDLLLKHVSPPCSFAARIIDSLREGLDQLESFLRELAKRTLKWPIHFSTTLLQFWSAVQLSLQTLSVGLYRVQCHVA